MEWIINNWQFLIGDILVPVSTFVIGLVVGRRYEKQKIARTNINGNNNKVYQNCDVIQEGDSKSAGKK